MLMPGMSIFSLRSFRRCLRPLAGGVDGEEDGGLRRFLRCLLVSVEFDDGEPEDGEDGGLYEDLDDLDGGFARLPRWELRCVFLDVVSEGSSVYP